MVQVKISQLIVAAGIAAGSLVGLGGIADAAPTASTSAVVCVNGDGAMDLVVTNPATDAPAEFVVTNPATFIASVIDVAPGSSLVVTVDGLADGPVVVPVQFNGNDASVSTQISCDAPPTCPAGVLTTVTDDSGVQRQACVESAAAEPATVVPATPAKSTLTRSVPPTTATNQLPQTGTGTGGLIIAALLVGSGSVASLLSRRKPGRS
jgi:LPXTG-motif cell wall-anchored protein